MPPITDIAELEVFTGVDERLELELFQADGVTELPTDGWTIHVHLAELPDAAPALALSSAEPTEVVEIDAAEGRWDAIIPQAADLKTGKHYMKVFGDDEQGKRHIVRLRASESAAAPTEFLPVMVRTGWVEP